MKKMQVTIEKMHYEPYPIKDMVTAWEVEYTTGYDAATEFLSSLRNNISRLKELFDTKSEWNYEIANADITLDGYPLVVNEKTVYMPYWDEIDGFVDGLENAIAKEEYESIMANDSVEI